jgi:phage virion morphogenesis protein
MSGASIKLNIKVTGAAEAEAALSGMAERADALGPAMRPIGQLVVTSVQRNFEAGGRPNAWAPLSWTTLMARARKGKGGWVGMSRGKILLRQGMAGGLMGSINARVEGNAAIVGTNKIYAAVHQFGARAGEFGYGYNGRRHVKIPWGDIPARPYLMLQDTDRPRIAQIIADFIAQGEVNG